MKKIFCIILSIILILSAFCIPSFASFNSLIDTEAEIVLLVNTDTGDVILDKNADKKNAPASLTKIVTAILVLENCPDISKKVVCKREVLGNLYLLGASTAGIVTGEALTIEQLLYCLMVPSAADAANILADYVGGDIPTFVNMMNDFAKKLGCNDTHFTNPAGLDGKGSSYTENEQDEPYTTANDLYKIASYALKNETFKKIVATTKYQIEPTEQYPHTRYLNTTNKTMNKAYKDYYCEYITGVKTGTTEMAGHCLLSTASKNGYNYLLVVMNAPQYDIDDDGVEENVAFTDSKKIYEWAFKNIVLTPVTTTTDIVTVVDVKYSFRTDHLALVPKEELTALVPSGTETGSLTITPIEKETQRVAKAPIKKGDVLGKAQVLYGEDVVATVDLVASESVNGSVILRITGFISYLFHTTVMKMLLLLVLFLIIGYVALVIRKNRIKAKRRKPRRIK